MLGKHYLVKGSHNKVCRYYTVVNCLKPAIYLEYLKLVQDVHNGKTPEAGSLEIIAP